LKVCSISWCCGRQVFATPPVHWALISTLNSFNNCATVRALFISPSMSTPTAVASQQASQQLAQRLGAQGIIATP
jgi:hypothetical protein